MTKENAHLLQKAKNVQRKLHAEKTQKEYSRLLAHTTKIQLHSSLFPGMIAKKNRAGILT